MPDTLSSPNYLLILDDDEGDRRHMKRVLRQAGVPGTCLEAESVAQARELCEAFAVDCAIVDYRLPGESGLSAIKILHKSNPHMALVMATGQGDETIATEAMKRGALDYFPKSDISPDLISRVVQNAIQKAKLSRKLDDQREDQERFAQLLVHDLTSPLRSVILASGLVEASIQEGDYEVALRMSKAVSDSAAGMHRLIKDLYEFTQAGLTIAFEPVSMEEVVNNALANLKHAIQEKNARVAFISKLPTILGSQVQLVQLMQNLIGNGIKYSDNVPACVEISAQPQPDRKWLFAVADNGIGIAEKDRTQIFASFRRSCDVSKFEGTGLGLAICKKIISRHSGRIWCESKQGEGSTFFFTLPEP